MDVDMEIKDSWMEAADPHAQQKPYSQFLITVLFPLGTRCWW